MPTKQSTPISLTTEERELILTLRSHKAAEVVTVPKAYLDLLLTASRDVSESIASLSRASNVLLYLNSQTVEEGVLL